jgi:hypothetical protein
MFSDDAPTTPSQDTNGGVWRTILAVHLKRRASRVFVVSAYPTQNHALLFDTHRVFSAPTPSGFRIHRLHHNETSTDISLGAPLK